MSFGRPPNISTFSPTPPEKGSFPLDHEGIYALIFIIMKIYKLFNK
jgi:hypothetical protein